MCYTSYSLRVTHYLYRVRLDIAAAGRALPMHADNISTRLSALNDTRVDRSF